MRYLKETLDSLLGAAGLQLEPWMAPIVAVLLAVLVMPAWRRNFRTKQARKRIQELSNAPPEMRARLQDEVLELTGDNPFGLVVVVEEALKRGNRGLAKAALSVLEATGKRRDEARRLRVKVTGERPTTPEAEALAVERLREAGLEDVAAERLHAARQKWPKHPSLR